VLDPLPQVREQVSGLLDDPDPVGLVVTPMTWTARVACSMKNRTWIRLPNTVSTWNRSQAKAER
jgi:hypothetical protein